MQTENKDIVPIVVGISGASGVVYAREFLRRLVAKHIQVHLSITPAGFIVIEKELGVKLDDGRPDLEEFLGMEASSITYHHISQIKAPPCSGSFETRGTVVVPCSMGRLATIASGIAQDFIGRCADVTLKEGRKLVLVPRETPLNLIHIRNILRVAEAGGVILPAMPGFYEAPNSIEDLVNFVVRKMLSQFAL